MNHFSLIFNFVVSNFIVFKLFQHKNEHPLQTKIYKFYYKFSFIFIK